MTSINTIQGFFSLLFNLVGELWKGGTTEFWVALAVGVLLAGVAWWLASYVAFNFNRQFSIHPKQHVYCGIAAILTLIFTLLFFALKFTGEVAERAVSEWQNAIRIDVDWKNKTFAKAYEAVYELKNPQGSQLEDFGLNHPHPSAGGTLIPTSYPPSKQAVANVYGASMAKHFKKTYPFLSLILWAKSEQAEKTVIADMERLFSTGAPFYDLDQAVELTSTMIWSALKAQAPRVIIISRIILIIAFLLIQALVFGLLARAALADIKEKRQQHRL
uniref:Uncharacterized protein n=1 Tax=Candidatus Kentrum sp. SD TaxID=2126332 RepID=A0A451BKZ9_9GAMM|nr:MAG: hypothetical protein BECKSD772F_GA0070984_10309 [Candidatus Kentron sp. SD]VFK43185.1 MAG: hypothetical protein BECKSD772E_GA0070983_10239 [Candidatus Kentron sp. SD]VFK78969.1 MAG: hypothetical protein BECKSD772D_GA0070982_10315 [Candidatus Kentron sp. SD]